MKIAICQLNPVIGAIEHNAARIAERIRAAAEAGARLAIFSEQALIGYPAKDLLLRREVLARNVAALQTIAAQTGNIAAIVGFAEPNDGPTGRPAFNSVALADGGRIVAVRRKRLLPTYDVFDETRYFEAAGPQAPAVLDDTALGLTVCEDIWGGEQLLSKPLYACDPARDLAGAGIDILVNSSASPWFLDKHLIREKLLREHARALRRPVVFVNQVGANDELIFDGASCVVAADGGIVAQARSFAEDLLVVDTAALGEGVAARPPAGMAALRGALVLGIRDYARKCGFQHAVLGLSGGIDSALVAALAAEALGPPQVHGVALPSRYSSDHSIADARALAENLGIRFSILPIEGPHAAFEQALAPVFAGRSPDVTEENTQARIRGVILMALSNKFGGLLLTTGNKSELAVGYCTLYGDMCGGLAVISDVPKTTVYRLAQHINAAAGRPVIPERSLSKPPSAELRPNQTDQDTLPPYEVLDAILERYEERLESLEQIVAAGFERDVVMRVVRLIHCSEYKRKQAAVGLKVTSRAFGFGRRMPIAARLEG